MLMHVCLVVRSVFPGVMGRWRVKRRRYGAFMVFMVILMMLRGSWSYLGGTAWYLGDLGGSCILNVLFALSWGFHGKLQGGEGCECVEKRVYWVMFALIRNVQLLLGGSIYMYISNTPDSLSNFIWNGIIPRGQITFLVIRDVMKTTPRHPNTCYVSLERCHHAGPSGSLSHQHLSLIHI